MAHVPLLPLGRSLPVTARSTEAAIREREAQLERLHAQARSGGGSRGEARVARRGQWTARERVARLLDPGSTSFEVGLLRGFDAHFEGKAAPGLGVVTLVGRIEDRLCVVIANDNTLASGAWWPGTPEKIQRAQRFALSLGLPVVYAVDCSGLFLPEQSRTFSGEHGAGAIFRYNSRLAARGIAQIAGVYGDCIAGGGYMPIISDRVLMTESAYMVIAGTALIKGAKGAALSAVDIGGPEVHVQRSGCADARFPDDEALTAALRLEVRRLPTSARAYFADPAGTVAPAFPVEELLQVIPADYRSPYSAEDVLARLVDASLFWEVMPHVGDEVMVGVGKLAGLYCGFIANRQGMLKGANGRLSRPGGVLYESGIAKLSLFRRACADDGLPLIWLQDISGFDIGPEAEEKGLLGLGSNLIYGNSTSTEPVCTVLLRKASGAGYYAMHGLPYVPALQLGTVLSRQAVMEGRTLALARYRPHLDDSFQVRGDSAEVRQEVEAGMRAIEDRIERDMHFSAMASRGDCDAVIPFAELRAWLAMFAEASYQSTGFRRHKNSRIWSLHELSRLGL